MQWSCCVKLLARLWLWCFYIIGDDTVKLWDIRQFRKPMCVAENLCNFFPMYVLVDYELHHIFIYIYLLWRSYTRLDATASWIFHLFTAIHAEKVPLWFVLFLCVCCHRLELTASQHSLLWLASFQKHLETFYWVGILSPTSNPLSQHLRFSCFLLTSLR